MSVFNIFMVLQFLKGIVISIPITDVTNEQNICQSDICKKLAQNLLNYMDIRTDPCKDFYKFSCGSFLKHELILGKSRASALDDVHEDLLLNLKSIFEDIVAGETNFEKQIKLSFHSCMNTTAITKDGQIALQNILQELGGWPLLKGDEWNEEKIDFTSTLIKLQMQGMVGLFNLELQISRDSNEFRVPMLSQPKLSFPSEYYEYTSSNSDMLEDLEHFILNVAILLHVDRVNKNTRAVVNGIVDFETTLAECSNTENLPEKEFESLTSLNKLKTEFARVFDFEIFFQSVFEKVNIEIKPNETIGILNAPYFNCLSRILEATPKRTVVNYLIWNLIYRSIIALPLKFEALQNIFMQKTGGMPETRPRWQKCVGFNNENLHQAVGYLYTKRFFEYSTKKKVLEFISKLKKAYKKLLSEEKWLAPETKAEAILKLEQMKDYIGYPDYLDSPKSLEEDFVKVNFRGKSFLEIFFMIKSLKMKEQLKSLRTPLNSDLSLMPIAVVNAFYDFRLNRIVFPAGILAPPFYSDSYPMYVNFGGIGTLIGHEIIHGFDKIGSQHDKDGVAREWWQQKDREMFASKSKCLVEQFDELVLKQINGKVDGELTLNENIADAGGVSLAYQAYKEWLESHGEEKQLPGINYTNEQMFFIVYGKNFCQKLADERALNGISNDPHSPHEFRVNMPLKNMESFSKVFKCRNNSEMNISKRCRVW